MERKELISEIINFYIEHELIKSVETENVKSEIIKHLKQCDFIESLINTIMIKTSHNKNINIEKTIDLLNALDRARLELEYYDR